MNRKQLILLVVVLAVVGVLGRFALQKKKSVIEQSGRGVGEKLFAEFPLNDITRVDIIESTQQVSLVKSGELWTVQERSGYPADYGKLRDMLRKFWEMKVTKPVRVPESRLKALQLQPPDQGSSVQVDFKGASDATLASVRLGANSTQEGGDNSPMGMPGGMANGRYVMVDNKLDTIALVSDTLSDVQPDPASWISKDFLKIEKLKSISVTATNAESSWTLTRPSETGTWALEEPREGETLDSSKVSSANYLLSSAYFNDVQPGGEDHPLTDPREAVLKTFDDFAYTLKLAKLPDAEDYALQISVTAELPASRTPAEEDKEEDKETLDKEFKDRMDALKAKLEKERKFGDWTYVLSKWSVDFLLKNRSDLLAAKTEGENPAGTNAASPAAATTPAIPLTVPENIARPPDPVNPVAPAEPDKVEDEAPDAP